MTKRKKKKKKETNDDVLHNTIQKNNDRPTWTSMKSRGEVSHQWSSRFKVAHHSNNGYNLTQGCRHLTQGCRHLAKVFPNYTQKDMHICNYSIFVVVVGDETNQFNFQIVFNSNRTVYSNTRILSYGNGV